MVMYISFSGDCDMERKIKIRIDKMGNTVVEADGFNGQGCEAATAPIERALTGGQGVERSFKPEWNNVEDEEHQSEHVTF
jgi:hypothetical protein